MKNLPKIDIRKLYPDKIYVAELFSSCCYDESNVGDTMYQDPYTKRFHTKDCIERKIEWLNGCKPDDEHSSGMLIKERLQELSELVK